MYQQHEKVKQLTHPTAFPPEMKENPCPVRQQPTPRYPQLIHQTRLLDLHLPF